MATMLLPFVLSLLFVSTTFGQSVIEECANYINAGDYQRAIKSGQRAVEMFPDNVHANFCLGNAYLGVGEFNLAVKYLRRAESLTSEKYVLSAIYNLLGQALHKMGDLDSALYYYSRKLAIDRERGDKESQALTLSNIAGVYLAKKDYNKAIKYFQKAIEMGERTGDYRIVADTYLYLGSTYVITKNYKLAEKYITEGLKRIQIVGDRSSEAFGYATLGALYKNKGDKTLAIAYLTKAYSIYKAIGAKSEAEKVKNALLELGVNPDKP